MRRDPTIDARTAATFEGAMDKSKLGLSKDFLFHLDR